jgi:signal transduction histidine kinase
MSRVEGLAAQRKIVIKAPKNIPYNVHGDTDQLTELFVVMLDNAIKYSPEKSTITVKTSKSGDQVSVRIEDNGVGINSEDLPHIFERFYRADQSRNKNVISGYGLGLSLAESIMKAHDGVIKVSSKPGKGTTFILEFPAV